MTDFCKSANPPDIFPACFQEDHFPFEIEEFLSITDESSDVKFGDSVTPVESPNFYAANSGDGSQQVGDAGEKKCKSGSRKRKEESRRVAFRTMSQVEIMDDGYKWRKYGKKSVKNSPNPRNYYRCSNGGCNVKKRVERDREDNRFVITTYEGVHNHESPCIIYCFAPRPADAFPPLLHASNTAINGVTQAITASFMAYDPLLQHLQSLQLPL